MTRLVPAVVAVFGGVVLALLLLVPFVFRSYRRRGELGFGPALLAFGFLVYGLALVAYTLLPIPPVDDAWCAAHAAHPQLRPLAFIDDIRKYPGVVHNPAVQQVLFNVALFVPLGAYARRWGVAVAAGFGVSLLIELTQLTGNWFLFPCAYRLFDVDDLLANTVGAAFGVLLAPLLRRMRGRTDLPADAPRPVTTGRRLLGMLVDLVAVFLLGGVLATVVTLLTPTSAVVDATFAAWLPATLLLLLPGLGGATFGQRAVRLRRTGRDGGRPGPRVVLALLFGGFGYWVLSGLDHLVPLAGTLSLLLLLASGVFAWRPRSHRGLSGLLSGLYVTDSRDLPPVAKIPVKGNRRSVEDLRKR